MKIRQTLLLAILFAGMVARAQSPDTTVARLIRFHEQTPQEKIYIRTDKELYTQNETLWLSAYLVDGQRHLASNLSSLSYVELLSPTDSVLITLPIKMIDGQGSGSILLSDTLGEGTYTIRGYTNYMRNFSSDFFFSKPIKLLRYSNSFQAETKTPPPADVDVQLFPEGGYLINGIPNIMGIKVTDGGGRGVNAKGRIVDQSGATISEVETSYYGMGKAQVTPQSGGQYSVVFDVEGHEISRLIPAGRDEGYQLSIRQTSKKTYITVKGTEGMDFANSYVVAHVRGQVVSVLSPAPGKNFIYSSIDNRMIPSGIVHITFFKEQKPMLERLVFNENANADVLMATELPDEIGQRQELQIDLNLLGMDSIGVNGSVSVAVLRSEDPSSMVDIESSLLLSSDLRGKIEHPEFYFDNDNPARKQALDVLLLTQGWRRFDWDDVVNSRLPDVNFYPEQGFTIEGQVVGYMNREKGKETELFLTFMENMAFRQAAKTEPDGTFWFDGLQIEDSVTAVIQTVKAKQKKKSEVIAKDNTTFVKLDDKTTPPHTDKISDGFDRKEEYRELVDLSLEMAQIRASFDGTVIILDAFEVRGKKDVTAEPLYRPNMLYKDPDSRLVLDSITGVGGFSNIFELIQGRFTGVQIVGTYPNQTAIIRGLSTIQGDNQAMFVVDGVTTDASLVSSIDPRNVSHIDVLKGSKGTMYGTPNGVILIYMRNGVGFQEDLGPRGFVTVQHFGYHQPDEFYVPQYDEMTAEEKVRPDRRTTQYWNPNVTIAEGKGSMSYYTSDDKGDFVLYVEGITTDGRIIKSSTVYSVR